MQRNAKRCVKEVSVIEWCLNPNEETLTSLSDVGGGIGAAVVRDQSDCIALIGGGRYSNYSSNQVHRQMTYHVNEMAVRMLLR